MAEYFTQTRGTGGNATATTVSTARSIGGTSLAVDSIDNWSPTTGNKVHFITYKKKSDGTIDKSTQCDWSAIIPVSGTTLTSLALLNGTDAGNDVGDFVEMAPTASWSEDLYKGLVAEHETDGTHDSTKVAMLAGTQTFTGDKTFTGAVDMSGASSMKLGNHLATGSQPVSATGNLAITGVGFKPKIVYFYPWYETAASSGANAPSGYGMMTSSAQSAYCAVSRNSNGGAAHHTTSDCVIVITIASGGGSFNYNLACNYVSMDSDGFTVNVNTLLGTGIGFDWVAEA